MGPESRDILLEAAWWDPSRIRRTRRALNLSTEASYRFERGIDLWGGEAAMRRCIELVLATAGGDAGGAAARPLAGADAPAADLPPPGSGGPGARRRAAVARAREAPGGHRRHRGQQAGRRPDRGGRAGLAARPRARDRPDRGDRPAARLRRVPVGPPAVPGGQPAGCAGGGGCRRGPPWARGRGILRGRERSPWAPAARRRTACACSTRSSADDAWLRRRLLPGLVRLVEANWANHVADVRLFEIGTAFAAGAPGERPREERRVAAVLTGRREPAHWTGTGEARFDLWDLKGRLEAAVALAIPGAEVQVEGQAWVVRDRAGRMVGEGGPLAADAPPWAAPLFGFELLRRPGAPPSGSLRAAAHDTVVRAGARPPPAGGGARAGGGDRCSAGPAAPLLERVDVESDYRGPELPSGTRSVAFRLSFRAPDRTLRDSEVDEVEARLLAALAEELGIQRRDGGSRTGE